MAMHAPAPIDIANAAARECKELWNSRQQIISFFWRAFGSSIQLLCCAGAGQMKQKIRTMRTHLRALAGTVALGPLCLLAAGAVQAQVVYAPGENKV